MNTRPTLLRDILTALEVRHTPEYTDRQFQEMPFKTVFGLSKVLSRYGIDSEALALADKSQYAQLPTPFIAQISGRFYVVTSYNDNDVSFIDRQKPGSIPTKKFLAGVSGIVIMAYPCETSCEPSYALHRNVELAIRAKKWVAYAAAIFIACYLIVTREIYRYPSLMILIAVDLVGLFASILLVRKELGFNDSAAERVCGVLRSGGCDDIMKTAVSKFYGIFGWSEVGLAYFSVTIIAMLTSPSIWGDLAVINLFCLPYTVWSIWYQRWRAHTWCTLCVTVQLMLWCQFFCYLFGSWYRPAFPVGWSTIALAATYIVTLLGLNALVPVMTQTKKS